MVNCDPILVTDDIFSTVNMLVPLCNKIASIKSKLICLSVNIFYASN